MPRDYRRFRKLAAVSLDEELVRWFIEGRPLSVMWDVDVVTQVSIYSMISTTLFVE